MSYDIYFVRNVNIDEDSVWEVLEAEVNEQGAHYIDSSEQKQISAVIEPIVSECEKVVSDRAIELNTPTYQISIFENQVVISLPYWDENQKNEIIGQVQKITNELIRLGFIGFDSHHEEFINGEYQLSFDDMAFDPLETIDGVPPRNVGPWSLMALVFGLLLIIVVVWMFLNSE